MWVKHSYHFILITLLALSGYSQAASDEFPGRKIYLDTPHIETKELNKEFDNSILIDVRSGFEYDTLHIKGAVNIHINDPAFIEKMKLLKRDNPKKKIITYCNGKSCMKSYKAAAKCRRAGIDGVSAYDAGVLDWVKAYPNRAVLLGTSPVNPEKLINKKQFEAHLLEPNAFFEQANTGKPMIIDVRDPTQRAGMPLFVGREKLVSMDDKKRLSQLLNKAKTEKRKLFIYDEAGKQVRWLMYYLEDLGVNNYYFMKGGAKSYFSSLRYDFK